MNRVFTELYLREIAASQDPLPEQSWQEVIRNRTLPPEEAELLKFDNHFLESPWKRKILPKKKR